MDFALSDEQQELQGLAKQIFGGERATWKELASAGLLGVAIPEEYGGLGYGIFELCLVVEEQGRAAVDLPLLPTLVTALALPDDAKAEWLPRVVAGDAILTAALEEIVPYAAEADAILIGDQLVTDADVTPVETTSGTPHGILGGSASAESAEIRPESPLRRLWTAALCAMQAGVSDEALRITAEYTKGRKQFDKPIASFQAVGQRAADAFIDVQAIKLTALQAAWRLAEGLPADEELAIAKFWAADGGQRVAHAAQHLHGGIGVDVDYPLHRYFALAKQIELSLGGATQQLLTIGRSLAIQPR
ncbi:MAG TPA: acyl-CoA dehydrogenase family protein [Acidimicrobiales bacterium]|nr:acyl-CoA dehydrogenase family protein [Acidimicrobiales bacterium]